MNKTKPITENSGDFIDNASISVHCVNKDGIIVWANKAELELLGYSKEEYLGQHISTFHTSQKSISAILSKLSQNESLDNYPAQLRCRDGSIKDVHINSSVFWDDVDFIHTRCFTRDVSEWMSAERKLKQHQEHLEELVKERSRELLQAHQNLKAEYAERLLMEKKILATQKQLAHMSRIKLAGEMASGLAHELNQPLSAIVNYASGCDIRLKKGEANPAFLSEYLHKIESEAHRCGNIIKSLRELITPNHFDRAQFKIHDAITDCLSLMKSDLRERKTKVEHNTSKKELVILSDRIQFTQVIINLINNASEALQVMPASKRLITITQKTVATQIEIFIQDNGPGINAEKRKEIFDPYVTTKKSGLGIGLSISRSIIEGLGGALTLHENGIPGACFNISLPHKT